MLTRLVLLGAPLGALLALTACGQAVAPEPADVTPSPSVPSTSPAISDGSDDGSDDGGSATPTGTPIGVPANVCLLLDPITVARLAGGKEAVARPSSQGPFHSCAYQVTTEKGATGTVYLDVSGQRTTELYDLATAGAQLSDLPAIADRASLSPATGRVYVLTSHAFFALTLPTDLGTLSTKDGLRAAAEELSRDVVARIGP